MDFINFLIDALIFLGVLSILVLVHEFGHFWLAKKARIKVEEFGLGFPPRVWGKRYGETIYSLNAIPIGGFVRLWGEEESVSDDVARAYYHKGKFVRASVVVAGVTMNILLAIFLFSGISGVNGVLKETGKVEIVQISPDSPAQKAGLQKGSIINEISGQKVSTNREFLKLVADNLDREISLSILYQEEIKTVSVVPRLNPPKGQGALGVSVADRELYHPKFPEAVPILLQDGVRQAWFWAEITVGGLSNMLSQAKEGKTPEGVAGPVGIFQIVSAIRKEGWLPLLMFAGILSVNLSILNILPFPALDGGRLLFIIVETLFGKRVLPAFEKHAHAVGMIILLGFVLAITVADVARLLSGISILPSQ